MKNLESLPASALSPFLRNCEPHTLTVEEPALTFATSAQIVQRKGDTCLSLTLAINILFEIPQLCGSSIVVPAICPVLKLSPFLLTAGIYFPCEL